MGALKGNALFLRFLIDLAPSGAARARSSDKFAQRFFIVWRSQEGHEKPAARSNRHAEDQLDAGIIQ